MNQRDDFKLSQHKNDHLSKLDGWRRNVGALVALDFAEDAVPTGQRQKPDIVQNLVVLSWNVWVGHGRLRELVKRIRRGDYAQRGVSPDMPLVVLAQEVYRQDPGITEGHTRHAGGTKASKAGQTREDIVETAHLLRMNLRYAPSMRNGAMQSDRGNAILSTLPLESSEAIELPHLLQRRVAVAATVRVGGGPLTMVSAHLDPRGPMSEGLLGARGRSLQTQHLLEALEHDTVIIGADLNLAGGRYEPTWRLLREAGFGMGVPAVLPNWRHTFHGIPRLVIDYLLVRDRVGLISHATVQRLDEHPLDRGEFVFGSDHHPLLSRVDVAAAGETSA